MYRPTEDSNSNMSPMDYYRSLGDDDQQIALHAWNVLEQVHSEVSGVVEEYAINHARRGLPKVLAVSSCYNGLIRAACDMLIRRWSFSDHRDHGIRCAEHVDYESFKALLAKPDGGFYEESWVERKKPRHPL